MIPRSTALATAIAIAFPLTGLAQQATPSDGPARLPAIEVQGNAAPVLSDPV